MAKALSHHTESALGAVFGLSPNDMKTLREFLVEGDDWFQKGRGIVYTDAGREKLQASLDIASGVISAPEKKEAADFVIWRVCRNPRIVLVKDSDGQVLRVRLRSQNTGCRPGMKLPGCVPLSEAPDLWQFNGHIRSFPQS